MWTKKGIEVIQPKPFELVGAEFILRGRVHESCLKTNWGSIDYRVLGSFVDIDGFEFASTVNADVLPNKFSWLTKKLNFSARAQFSQFNIPFIRKSRGRIALKLATHEEGFTIFLPLIVKGFETENGIAPEIIERHGKIGELVKQYEQDLRDYYKELAEINASRKRKDDNKEPQYITGQNIEMAFDILKILDDSDENFEEYIYSEEDKREQKLEEKYKDALEWRGSLLRGIVSQFGGFELRVYSNDHGKHFHVIHKGKGINARFSFPEIRLMNYKILENTISSKQEKRIREYCLRPEIFSKFEQEFQKRIQS